MINKALVARLMHTEAENGGKNPMLMTAYLMRQRFVKTSSEGP